MLFSKAREVRANATALKSSFVNKATSVKAKATTLKIKATITKAKGTNPKVKATATCYRSTASARQQTTYESTLLLRSSQVGLPVGLLVTSLTMVNSH